MCVFVCRSLISHGFIFISGPHCILGRRVCFCVCAEFRFHMVLHYLYMILIAFDGGGVCMCLHNLYLILIAF